MFIRSKINPILSPIKDLPWADAKIYNPGAVYFNEKYYLFFRAVGEAWVSKIGLAVSEDGINFEVKRHPVIEPQEDFENNGVEDPRVCRIGDEFYMTYTAYDGKSARLCLATSLDLINWQQHGLVFSNWNAEKAQSFLVDWDKAQQTDAAKVDWHKAGAIFPHVIKGKYWMLFGDRHIWLASSDDGIKWEPNLEPFLKARADYFDSVHIEMGPPPMLTPDGWLCLYHGIDKTHTYRLGAVILDKNDPTVVLHRTAESLLEPREPYEIMGLVDIMPGGSKKLEIMEADALVQYIKQALEEHTMPQVVFCSGAIIKDNIIRVYYGAGDSTVCTAEANLDEVLKFIKN